MKYAFNDDGAIVAIKNAKNADPQAIGEAIERVRLDRGGELHPGDLVDAAKDPASVLHRHFEWDNKVAAESYRLDQARAIIRLVRVVDKDGDQSRAFVSIRSDHGVSYRSIGDVLQSKDLRERVLEQAEKDLAAWQTRYRELHDLVERVEPIRAEISRRRNTKRESRPSA